jgi:PKD repeat protein
LRFRFESDGAGGVADGWHVDDVVLQGGGPGCLPCDPVDALDFAYAPPAPLVGEVVAFTGTATGTAPIAYTWAFGDGGTASGITATHAYTAAGTYTVTLTAENCAGAAAVAHVLTVTQPCEQAVIAGVTPEISGCAVTLTAALTGTAPFTYLWAWGDGMTSTAAMPTHTYAQSGTYSGTLEVWNCADAGHDTAAFTVQVECAAPMVSVYLPIVVK